MKLSPAPFRDPMVGADGRCTRSWQEWFSELQRVLVAAPAIRAFAGDPNASIPGVPGDLVANTNGGANLSLYVKESGVGTLVGWVPK